MKHKRMETAFFFAEVLFMLLACGVALYNIYFETNTIPLLVVLGGYILSIKGLRRIFTDEQGIRKLKTKLLAFVYLSASTFLLLQLSSMVFG